MTITLEIGPELQAELMRRAAAQGMGIDAYAAGLLEEAIHPPALGVGQERAKHLRDVFEAVRGLADDVDFSRNPSTGRPTELP